MNTRVLLFAAARERARSEAVEVDLPAPATVAELRAALAAQYPALAAVLARSAIAVNGRYAAPSQAVTPGADVALIPPVSGG